jgi:hypothetical protein
LYTAVSIALIPSPREGRGILLVYTAVSIDSVSIDSVTKGRGILLVD